MEERSKVHRERDNTTKPTLSVAPLEDLAPTKPASLTSLNLVAITIPSLEEKRDYFKIMKVRL